MARSAITLVLAVTMLCLAVSACGSGGASGTAGTSAAASTGDTPSGPSSTSVATGSTTTTAPGTLPGAGKPQIVLGDKNFTEQFVLGELYKQALVAEGFDVLLNRNIGPTEVTIPAVESGRVDIYPEYLSTWDSSIAAYKRPFSSRNAAYLAGQRYALAQGLQLLNPTPFTDTEAIAVARGYAEQNGLSSLGDLRKVEATLSIGGPPQFQQDAAGLPALEQAYGFTPASFTALEVGGQYHALDQGTVQAAEVNTTDGELSSGQYVLLRDPRRVFGWGNVVPVVSARALMAEGPAFAATIDRVDALLSTAVMRRLNAAVDISHEDPAAVAKQFLQAHGLVPATP